MGRKYVRISLGGARDEADIRGHRRTYIGALPGRIIAGHEAGGQQEPGLPARRGRQARRLATRAIRRRALLEVLDPAQNDSFTDHYLGVPFDLSEVMFIATANFLQNIPGPLLDRMEVVDFAGYTEREKLAIAKNYLVPRQLEDNGLRDEQLELTDDAIREVITSYTREAGVRQLERELGRLARKVARRIAAKEIERAVARSRATCGRCSAGRACIPRRRTAEDQVGIATGMYYTPAGGDIMFVEAAPMRGKGELILTGQLGDVMKESAARRGRSRGRTRRLLGIDERGSSATSTSTCRRARSRRTARRRASRWRRRSCRRCRAGPCATTSR